MMGRTIAAMLLLTAGLPSLAAAQTSARPGQPPSSVPSTSGAQALNQALDNQAAIATTRAVNGNIESMRPSTGGGAGKAPGAPGASAATQNANLQGNEPAGAMGGDLGSAQSNNNPYYRNSANQGEMVPQP